MNFDSIAYEANTDLDIAIWSGKSYANKLPADDVLQSKWDMGLLGVLENDFPSIAPVPSKSLNGSSTVHRVGTDPSISTPGKQKRTEPVPLDHNEMQMKVDFFRKLGYSSEEISVVLQKLGLAADTNTVLGELVKHGAAATDREAAPEGPTEYCLVPRGGGSTPSPAPVVTPEENESEQFKPVVIDGSNVAMSHGNKEVFSCLGISLAVNWFLERGHTDITVFVPSWRKEQPRPDVPITDQNILRELEKQKILVFTPSRRVGGKRVVCYDDRFIVKLAYESDGIVVSNDTYRDLQNERPEWKKFIEERLLMYSFVNDKFMPPDDPLGRHGPSLDNFLRKKAVVPEHKKPQCPYGKKCTYGIKCKFYHPERINHPQRSVADELRANARQSPTKSTAGAQKEEKRSRKPSHVEVTSAVPTDSDKASMQKISVERRNSSHKGSPSIPESSGRGNTSNSVSSHCSGYGSGDWYSQPSSRMDSISYTSQDGKDSGYISVESQLAGMWNCRSSSHCEHSHHEQMASCGYCSCSMERQSFQPSRGAEHGSYHQHAHHHQDFHKPITSSCTGSSFLPYVQDQSHARSSYSVPGYVRQEHQPPAGTHSLPNEYHPASMHSQYYSEPHQYNLTSAPSPYCSEPHQMSHHSRSRVPHQLHSSSAQQSQWSQHDAVAKERSSARTKLCGIFNPHLVDTVMNLHPHLTDPQRLAAEIFAYKTQHPGM